MKFSLRLALTIFLSGTCVLLLISYLSYHYHPLCYGICRECAEWYYPEMDLYGDRSGRRP